MATAIERRTLVLWQTEPVERAPVRSTDTNAESFTATGAGSTTTTVCAALTAATADVYCGHILRCVAAVNAQNVGCDAEITAFTVASDTLTHTEFPAATASTDQFVILVPPDPIFVESAGGSTTAVTDASRTEVANTYAGDYVIARRTTNAVEGEQRLISASSNVGVLTHAALSGASTVGDLYYVRRAPKFWGPPALAWTREDIEHVAQRGNFSKDQSIAGCKTWTAECVLPLKGTGTGAGDGSFATAPYELKKPLDAIFTPIISAGELAAVGGTTSVLQVTDGTLAQFPVGSLGMDGAGRMFCVTGTAADGGNPDDITINPPLQRAPITGETMYGGYAWSPMLTGHKTMTLDCHIGGTTNVKLYGGLPTVKITDFGRNLVPKITLSYQGGYWLETKYPTPTGFAPIFDTVRPVDSKDCHAILCVTGTTTNVRLVLKKAEIDLGYVVQMEDAFTLPDAMFGGRIVDCRPMMTLTMIHDTSAPVLSFAELLRYMGGQTFSILLQHGKDVGNTFGVYAHKCAYKAPAQGVADNLRELTLTVEVLASELASMPDIVVGIA